METLLDAAAEALRQVRDGRDFPPPRQILSRIPGEVACRIVTPNTHSLATNVKHADFWQRLWLAQLLDEPRPNIREDWSVVVPDEWSTVREAFLANLNAAVALAETVPFRHFAKSDEIAIQRLLQIAIHDAYHVGQWVILKRAVRKGNMNS